MLPHVEHLIELAEGTVRSHGRGLVRIHLDVAQAISWQAWGKWLLAFFFVVVMSKCPQNPSRRRNPPDDTLWLCLCQVFGHILLSRWWVLLVIVALCVLVALALSFSHFHSLCSESFPLSDDRGCLCRGWSPIVTVFFSPAVHIHHTAGRHLWWLQAEQSALPSSRLSWTWCGTDCKTIDVRRKAETLSRGWQELYCLSLSFMVLMRHGSAVLYCCRPAGCKLTVIKETYIRRCVLIGRGVH